MDNCSDPEASNHTFNLPREERVGLDGSENVILVSPSGSVALNSPITVPMAEFSAMVRLLTLMSLGAEFAKR